jgi:hypothetical protein
LSCGRGRTPECFCKAKRIRGFVQRRATKLARSFCQQAEIGSAATAIPPPQPTSLCLPTGILLTIDIYNK